MASIVDDVIAALTESVLAPAILESARVTPREMVGRIREFVTHQPIEIRRVLNVLWFLLEFAPVPAGRGRFSRMDVDRRAALIEDCERTRIAPVRNVVHALKFLVLHVALGDPAVEESLGARPHCAFDPSLLREPLP